MGYKKIWIVSGIFIMGDVTIFYGIFYLALIFRNMLTPLVGLRAVAALIGLWLSAIPFVRRVAQQDHALVVAAPLFIVMRALASAIGVAGGIVGMFLFRPALPHNRE